MSSTATLPDPVNEATKARHFCAVALGQNERPTVGAVAEKLRKLFAQRAEARDLVEEEAGIGFVLNGCIVCIIHRPCTVPIETSTEPIIKQPLTVAALDAQQAHLAIAAQHCDPAHAAIAATQVTAALVECCPNAVAVYWHATRQWIAPRLFVERAVKLGRAHLPIDLWIDCRVWSVGGKDHAGFTRGLKALGHKEFEVRSSPESAKDLRERLEGLCRYVLTRGPIIRDGHTVGHREDERISILLCRSVHGLQDTVLRLDYAEDFKPRRPWWKLI